MFDTNRNAYTLAYVETWPARIAVSRNTASSSTTSRSTNSSSTSTSISNSRRAVPAGKGGSRYVDTGERVTSANCF
ncbi:hypothetical protein V1477_020401 [Vespula maculifrons]|uniref:Uncharacterized protein n=1 Tax=Vespula maculifrons TaxID=7453 RepID=A0ABD2AME7_VESMC